MSTANGATTGSDTQDGIRFSLWRHRDATAHGMSNAYLGDQELHGETADEAQRAYVRGARFVSIEPPVDLSAQCEAARTIPVLSFVRDLTSHGMEVEWHARIASDGPQWWVFSHLFPPSILEGRHADEMLAAWRSKHHVGKCFLRRGPGFVQIRDRRRGGLRRLTIADGEYISAIDAFLAGKGPVSVSDRVVSTFEAQDLLIRLGGSVWWAPCRLQRWPLPSWEV